ncbi:MAG: Gfo/Idh/MocA family protein [Armatimonadota bacterium]
MSAQKRIAILGGGGILGAHAPALKKMADRCTVTAVAEPREDRHPYLRQVFGDGLRVYADYHELLQREEVDAVDILLPHYLHAQATLEAAALGRHVLVEKVMARNVYECDLMIDACERAGVSLTICHDRRYHGQWMALKEIVDSGMLGEIFYWKLDHNQNVVFPEGSWVRMRDGLGGGAIMSCLTHQIDSLRWLGGEVADVMCMTKVIPERMQGETLGIVGATMQSGALAHLAINWYTRSNTAGNGLWYEMVQVCGTKGEAYYLSNKGTFLLLHEPSEIEQPFVYEGVPAADGFRQVQTPEWGGHEGCIREWVKMLCGEPAQILTSGRDVRGTVEVAEAAYRSVETGQRVVLPIAATPWVPEPGCPYNPELPVA